jgi:ferredoxin-NADP reductase
MTAAPQKTRPGPAPIDVIVSDIVPLNGLVTRFEFARADGGAFPPFSGGAHTVIEMQDGDITRRNPYSLMSDPADNSHYAISVRRDDAGRGGSLFMHNKVKIGDKMRLTYPVNLFALDLRAKKQLFIAGGIGITPFLAQIKQLAKTGGNWELHYSVRSRDVASYVDELTAHYPHQTHIYYDEEKNFIKLDDLLSGQPLGTHVYICGPKGMIEWVHDTANKMGWPEQNLHSEEFKAPDPGKPFSVTLSQSGKTIQVGETQSLLEAIEAEGIDAPFSCRAGACGQCETEVSQCDGTLIHNDHWLEDDEKAAKTKIMPCVSRFEGKTLVIDR